MLAPIQVSPYSFCRVSYVESKPKVGEFERTSNSAQIILPLVIFYLGLRDRGICNHLTTFLTNLKRGSVFLKTSALISLRVLRA